VNRMLDEPPSIVWTQGNPDFMVQLP